MAACSLANDQEGMCVHWGRPWEGAMSDLKQLFSDLIWDESGQDLIEYAFAAALIALVATAAMRTLATAIGTALIGMGTKLTGAI